MENHCSESQFYFKKKKDEIDAGSHLSYVISSGEGHH